MLFLVELSFV